MYTKTHPPHTVEKTKLNSIFRISVTCGLFFGLGRCSLVVQYTTLKNVSFA